MKNISISFFLGILRGEKDYFVGYEGPGNEDDMNLVREGEKGLKQGIVQSVFHQKPFITEFSFCMCLTKYSCYCLLALAVKNSHSIMLRLV